MSDNGHITTNKMRNFIKLDKSLSKDIDISMNSNNNTATKALINMQVVLRCKFNNRFFNSLIDHIVIKNNGYSLSSVKSDSNVHYIQLDKGLKSRMFVVTETGFSFIICKVKNTNRAYNVLLNGLASKNTLFISELNFSEMEDSYYI